LALFARQGLRGGEGSFRLQVNVIPLGPADPPALRHARSPTQGVSLLPNGTVHTVHYVQVAASTTQRGRDEADELASRLGVRLVGRLAIRGLGQGVPAPLPLGVPRGFVDGADALGET